MGYWFHLEWLHLWCMGIYVPLVHSSFSFSYAIYLFYQSFRQHLSVHWHGFQITWTRISPWKWIIHLNHGQLVGLFIQKMDCWCSTHSTPHLHTSNSICQLVTQFDYDFLILGQCNGLLKKIHFAVRKLCIFNFYALKN